MPHIECPTRSYLDKVIKWRSKTKRSLYCVSKFHIFSGKKWNISSRLRSLCLHSSLRCLLTPYNLIQEKQSWMESRSEQAEKQRRITEAEGLAGWWYRDPDTRERLNLRKFWVETREKFFVTLRETLVWIFTSLCQNLGKLDKYQTS